MFRPDENVSQQGFALAAARPANQEACLFVDMIDPGGQWSNGLFTKKGD
jgi:hypothetical protein